ncbi:MAG: outer membrane lipoprotein carrier protein LolA [Bacteroidales bacterium]
MMYKIIIVLLFSLPIVSQCFSQDSYIELKDPAGFKQRFSESTKRTQTIEANFVQEKNLSVFSEKITTRGTFLFKKERRLRWEYTDPFHYLIIINNGTMVIQDEDKTNKIDVQSNKLFKELNSIIIGCVQGDLFNDVKKFQSSFLENRDNYLVKLKPAEKDLKEYLNEIQITLDKKDLLVTRFEMTEPSGDNTIIFFKGRKINTNIPDEKFLVP